MSHYHYLYQKTCNTFFHICIIIIRGKKRNLSKLKQEGQRKKKKIIIRKENPDQCISNKYSTM